MCLSSPSSPHVLVESLSELRAGEVVQYISEETDFGRVRTADGADTNDKVRPLRAPPCPSLSVPPDLGLGLHAAVKPLLSRSSAEEFNAPPEYSQTPKKRPRRESPS
eukprot:899340-Prorocentrum_minimum.AAC.1